MIPEYIRVSMGLAEIAGLILAGGVAGAYVGWRSRGRRGW